MTVEELINKLQALPKEYKVYVPEHPGVSFITSYYREIEICEILQNIVILNAKGE